MKTAKPLSIGLVPDRFARYRFPVFRALSQGDVTGFDLTIYADTRERLGIPLASPIDCKKAGLAWRKTRDGYLAGICFWQTGLIKLALSKKHDILVYWGEAHRLSTWLSVVLARVRNKKVLFWTHGLYGNEGPIKKLVRIWFYRLADGLMVYGRHAQQLLEREGYHADKMFVINNSLDCKSQDTIYRELSVERVDQMRSKLFGGECKVICFVGRLEKQKRLELLIQAIRLLRKQGISAKLLLIGDGGERRRLTEIVSQFALEKDVIFYGACYDDNEVIPLVAMSDVVVAPGEVGLTAMHALIAGTPVVTHDDLTAQMPEVEAVRDGVSGYRYKRGDLSDLVSKIKNCFDDLEDGRITAEGCRKIVLEEYAPEYQRGVFCAAVREVWRDRCAR